MPETLAATARTDLVRRFFDLLEARDVASACDLLADDVVYINVSTPAIRGRARTRRFLEFMLGLPGAGLEVYIHKLAVDGESVLAERTDALIFGPVRVQVWVWGRFDVVDGRIVLWKDYFDWLDTLVATVRGLVGAVIPSLRAKPPVVAAGRALPAYGGSV
jgi:limonene-1,2-epoxide hydrolase